MEGSDRKYSVRIPNRGAGRASRCSEGNQGGHSRHRLEILNQRLQAVRCLERSLGRRARSSTLRRSNPRQGPDWRSPYFRVCKEALRRNRRVSENVRRLLETRSKTRRTLQPLRTGQTTDSISTY